jgi:hypothetical protein
MFSNRFGVGVLKHPGYNGKGGGGAPTQNTSYQTNIPEYAEPYVHNMLGATQKQLFNMSGNSITGFKPYTPYSTDMNDYVAGFSPLQQRAQQNAANMQMPGQFGMANQMAGAAGLGSLGLAGQAANAGNQFQQQATNPYAVQQYMNPYLQASLDPQIENIRRQYGITGTQQQGQATQAGAFGGSREALMAAENNRAMNAGINNAITQGYNNAFNNAQQQQQFGANLGLQGYQTGLSGLGQAGQAASTLGQLGGQEQSALQNIINAQNTMGAQQQSLEQQKINQAIQDYATQQQYPMMQLGMMSNMIRGLPLQGVTTQSYQAQPSLLSQGIGAIGSGYALQNALGGGTPKAAGGQIKSYAKGGIASYDVGGAIESDLYDYSPEKLKEIAQTSQSETVRNKARAILREKTSYAPGGIVAFSEGDKVEENKKQIEEDRKSLKKLGLLTAYGLSAPTTVLGNILGGAYNGLATGSDELLNKIGVPRAGRALGIYDADVTSVALPKIGSGSAMPIQDAVVNKYKAIDNPPAAEKEEAVAAAKPAKQLNGPFAPNADPQVIAEKQAAMLKEKYGLNEKPVPANEAKPAKEAVPANEAKPNAQPAATGNVPETTTSQGIISAMTPEAQKYMGVAPAAESEADYLKRKEEYLGPNTGNIEYRKQIMAERANAADEAKRQESLRMAEFFSTWGSTPGPTLVAGMQAVQKTIPNIIADKKDQKKAKQESDKILNDLDRAIRLEKEGNWDEAQKRKEEAAKNMQNWLKAHTDIAAKASENATRIKTEEMQGRTSRDVATIGANASMATAAESRAGRKQTTDLSNAQTAEKRYDEGVAKIDAEIAAPKGEYQKAKGIVDSAVYKKAHKEDPNSTTGLMYSSAVKTLDELNKTAKARKESLAKVRNSYRNLAGFDESKFSAVDNSDILGIR